MAVIHILKDGTQVKDIKGHVVTQKEVPQVYMLLESMNKKGKRE